MENRQQSDCRYCAVQALAGAFCLGFRFLAWLNGLGVLLILLCSAGLLDTDLDAQWLRLPFSAFLGGLALCALGLLWTYPAQSGLIHQLASGRARRSHWVPMACTLVAYTLSLLAFLAGCWFLQSLMIFTSY